MWPALLCAITCWMPARTQDTVTFTPRNRKVAYFVNRVVPKLEELHLGSHAVWTLDLTPPPPDANKDMVRIRPDFEKNALLLDGPKDKVEDFRQILALFDTAPRLVELTCTLLAPIEGTTFETTAKIEEGTTWTAAADSAQTTLKVKPRINDDGTVTLALSVELQNRSTSFVLRLKDGENGQLAIEPQRFKVGSTESTVLHIDPNLRLTCRARILPPPQKSG